MPIIKAGLAHRGFAFIDVISPCVTFNDHEGSTKSYAHTREHAVEVVHADFVPLRDPIETDYAEGSVQSVTLHDGSIVKLRKVAEDYDPTNRDAAYAAIRDHQRKGEVMTGLLYHLAGFEGRARPERNGRGAALQPAARAALPGQRRAAEADGAVPLKATTKDTKSNHEGHDSSQGIFVIESTALDSCPSWFILRVLRGCLVTGGSCGVTDLESSRFRESFGAGHCGERHSARRSRAQQPAATPPPAPAVFTPLRRNVGIFNQRGGTIGWMINSDGVLVVDSQFADTAPNLLDRAERAEPAADRRPASTAITIRITLAATVCSAARSRSSRTRSRCENQRTQAERAKTRDDAAGCHVSGVMERKAR